jgi:hypothetical protein
MYVIRKGDGALSEGMKRLNPATTKLPYVALRTDKGTAAMECVRARVGVCVRARVDCAWSLRVYVCVCGVCVCACVVRARARGRL